MIKKERTKKVKLMQNPYSYYVTNWGFVGPNQTTQTDRSVNKKS
ncbi:hypothetical protein SAMN05421877_105179 [Sphingobacterium lactis]|uniref:Uncharacterized protein n=1 Tax=Sphingobacterium lactis TaxID=797291 RepID=A0A1H5XZJ8_9SPHI|nr:hypothetical protein SAMN05421877_105179 [Sphingobacterium lactis]